MESILYKVDVTTDNTDGDTSCCLAIVTLFVFVFIFVFICFHIWYIRLPKKGTSKINLSFMEGRGA